MDDVTNQKLDLAYGEGMEDMATAILQVLPIYWASLDDPSLSVEHVLEAIEETLKTELSWTDGDMDEAFGRVDVDELLPELL